MELPAANRVDGSTELTNAVLLSVAKESSVYKKINVIILAKQLINGICLNFLRNSLLIKLKVYPNYNIYLKNDCKPPKT